mmetsp:Transcript_49869/g.115828  ORF Transcript_49869/g.115828 Transcript_49869/m.115828 type:complete len:222 (-) Transcript_49869:77-742(-)|eukprot:CAMPEP_0171093378 /NCGR_PEP_ID=MMETSP0766_2-20121228/39044_1 /TAXON_ID=439317 /ORGANISM="Gambierdiscus australes, Strain CAWD 149" /LENGTH=221 /DNA_ID=CAMNT_0011551817 /DNA_START=54 /DNA_END=719 /DNA_ORIENTATION=-
MASTKSWSQMERGPDGLYPQSDMTVYKLDKINMMFFYPVFITAMGLPGIIASSVVLFFTRSTARLQVAMISSYHMEALYFSLAVLQLTYLLINGNMAMARRTTRVNVPDQHVYRVYGGQADKALVFMADEANFGRFNRAQRALANFEEFLPLTIAHVVAASFVFPWTTFVGVLIIGMGRVKGAIDYTTERTKRMSGNSLSAIVASSLLWTNIMIGLAALAM